MEWRKASVADSGNAVQVRDSTPSPHQISKFKNEVVDNDVL